MHQFFWKWAHCRVRTDPGKSWNWNVEISRPGKSWKRHRSWKTLGPGNFSFWFKYHLLDKKFIVIHFVTSLVNSDFRNTFILLLNILWPLLCSHRLAAILFSAICSASWKVLENNFLSPGIWSLQVLENSSMSVRTLTFSLAECSVERMVFVNKTLSAQCCRIPYWQSEDLGSYWCCSSRPRWVVVLFNTSTLTAFKPVKLCCGTGGLAYLQMQRYELGTTGTTHIDVADSK